MADMPGQIEIGHVETDIIVTEGVGPLSKADVQQLVSLVLQQLRHEQDMNAQRAKDTTIQNQVYPPQER
jgi:hypothetical protein